MRSFLFVVGAICLFACKSTKEVVVKDRFKTPPNCVLVDSILWCDKTEVTYIDWQFYQSWLRRVYGAGSMEYERSKLVEYQTLLSDISKEEDLYDVKGPGSGKCGFYSISFDLPIVGLSHEQARTYSIWRTDRVAESQLISKGKIKWIRHPNASNRFTLEDYLRGNYQEYVPDSEITHVFVFDLPTDKDREKAMNYWNVTYQTKGQGSEDSWITRETREMNTALFGTPFSPVEGEGNDGAIHHLKGNVAEWGKEPGVVYGGSWKQNRKQVEMIDKMKVGTEPRPWIGFRNICRSISVEEYLRMVENKETYK